MRRGRTITFGGRILTPAEVWRFEVVRAVLLEQLSVREGAELLEMPEPELARLVTGARDRVIATLGIEVLEEARHPYRLAS